MADFFSGVYGARFPDVVMNQGPLPGTGGLPNPLHDTVDGRINYNSSLLGDIQPYAYGEPGYLSSQNAYLNIPHRIQKIVPCLYLPEPHDNKSFTLNHPIDDGDIAFTMRLDRKSEVCSGLSNRSMLRAGLGTAIDPMINLCTLNYLLAGIQISTHLPGIRTKWDQLLHHLDKRRFDGNPREYNYLDIKHIVRHLVRPFGVAHGSEKQGGQHEGSLSSVQWPVSFVISLILDGKDANVVNIWNYQDVEAGNDLVLRLKVVEIPQGGRYTLNHFPKSLTEKTFTAGLMEQVAAATGGHRITHVWQLVPDIFSLDMETPAELQAGIGGLNPNFVPQQHDPAELAWQQEGYWHIARAQVHSRSYGTMHYFNDMANNLRNGHIDVTFQPTFYAIPYRDVHSQHGGALHVRTVGPGAGAPAELQPNVHNFIGSSAGDKRNRQLRLEQGFADAPPPPQQESFTRRVAGRSNGSTVPISVRLWDDEEEEAPPRPNPRPNPRPIAAPAGGQRVPTLPAIPESGADSGLAEDIGVFDDPGPLPSLSTAAAPPPFSVPKPGLKSARKPAARGKGVLSSVLAADGSVTQQQASML
jgi:hypothetical protein